MTYLEALTREESPFALLFAHAKSRVLALLFAHAKSHVLPLPLYSKDSGVCLSLCTSRDDQDGWDRMMLIIQSLDDEHRSISIEKRVMPHEPLYAPYP